MKNPPVLSIGRRATSILKYISNKGEVVASEIQEEFNLNGNGIYLTNLKDRKLIDKISRGKYKITESGIKLLEIIKEIEKENEI